MSGAAAGGAPPADEDAGDAAARTGLAWSRTLIAFAGVIGLIGVRAVVLEAPPAASAAILSLSGALLLANGALTRRAWAQARRDIAGGKRVVHATPAFVLAAATAVLALTSLAILITGAPPA